MLAERHGCSVRSIVGAAVWKGRTMNRMFLGILIAAAPSVARGQSFDAGAQFSATSNPTGAWSYGEQPTVGGAFSLFEHQIEFGIGGYFWGPAAAPGSPPFIGKNTTESPVFIPGDPVLPPGTTMFHPGPIGQRAVVRWTSPGAGNADVYVYVGGVAVDQAFASSDVAIVHNESILAASSDYSNSMEYSFSTRIAVQQGDTVDLSQGFGTNGDYFNDSTAFRFTMVLNRCIADLTGDSLVDDGDFAVFAPAYNLLDCADPAMPPNCPADINRDTFVDDADFTIFAVGYNELICP